MIDERQAAAGALPAVADYVAFHAAGELADGEFHCAECGYGVAVRTTLPMCPMCGGASWEPSSHPRVVDYP